MKKLHKTYCLLLTAFCLLASSQTKAQGDPNVGFYADGIKVTELPCYSFKTLHAVLPYNDALNSISEFALRFDVDKYHPMCTYKISKGSLLMKRKGKYLVLEIFNEKNSTTEIADITQLISGNKPLNRNWLAYYFDKSQAGPLPFNITIESLIIVGYEEAFDESCNCVKKTPQYKQENIDVKTSVLLKNRIKGKYTSEVDMSQPCTVSGTKVDFNNLK